MSWNPLGLLSGPDPPSPTFRAPWRKIQYGDKAQREFVQNYQPKNSGQHLRVLLYGPPGSGKSSFINSVGSVLRGKITTEALVATAYEHSFTNKYRSYEFQKEESGTVYPFIFSDTMGIEKGTERGVNIEDIKLILKGNVKERYTFNPLSSLSESDPFYNSSPTVNDKVHVLVCLVPANTSAIMDEIELQQMQEVRKAASDLGIPQISILTKVDEACTEVKKDLKNLYRSKYIKKQMDEVSAVLGIPMNCIFPVKNYHSEMETDDDVDTVILSAFRKIIDYGEDFLNKQLPPAIQGPWRKIKFGDKAQHEFVRNYQPKKPGQHLRVLLYGPPGSGKSSFINSVGSALQGKITSQAPVASEYDGSFTNKYRSYEFQKEEPGTVYPFIFSDTMGIEKGTERGVNIEDIKLILKGNVKEGYTFNPLSSLSESDPFYNSSPTVNDKVHVLVCLIPANTPAIMDEIELQQMQEVRKAASDLGIPQISILTKVDEACTEVKKDLKNIYRSKYIKKQVDEVSAVLGILMNCIFPVKNYHSETETDDDVDTVILDALRKIIDYGEDFLNKQPPPAIQGPWRKIKFGDKAQHEFVRNYQPKKPGQHLRVLLYGPPGSGKSSFINSVGSALRGKITTRAPVASEYDGSFTNKYRSYEFQKENTGAVYPFIFSDTMGIETGTNGGVNIEDIKLILKGNVKEGYKFNPVSCLSESDPFYNRKPAVNDKVHVLVCVVPANTPAIMDDKVVREVRDAASELEIPQIAVVTKIDEACPVVKEDLKNVCKSNYIKNQVKEVNAVLGIPINCIFPVKNYSSEIETDDEVDTLILSALRKIIDSGEDFLSSTPPERWCSIL